jgi:hypothetical protein
MNSGIDTRKLAHGVTYLSCILILLSGYARTQESRPQMPDVETPAETQKTPIAAEKKPNVGVYPGR